MHWTLNGPFLCLYLNIFLLKLVSKPLTLSIHFMKETTDLQRYINIDKPLKLLFFVSN